MISEVKTTNRLSELYKLRSENEALLKKDPTDFTAKHILSWVIPEIKLIREQTHKGH